MASQRTFTSSQGWVLVSSLLVTELNIISGGVNAAKFQEFAEVNEFVDVRTLDASPWLAYRVHTDSHDGPISRTGYLPMQRVVQVIALT